jgi:glycogen debranching enzyme
LPEAPPRTDDGQLQLHVPAQASFQERRAHTLKHGKTFAVFDRRGDITAGPDSPDGLYLEDTRIVSRFELRLDGERPLLLSANADDNAGFNADLTNVDLYRADQLVLARELIHCHRLKFVWEGAMYERILLRNYDDRTHRLTLDFDFDADFADIFEVRGETRARRGSIDGGRDSESSVAFDYTALDGVRTAVAIAFDPPPARLERTSATFELSLEPRASVRIFSRAGRRDVADEPWQAVRFYTSMRAARRALVGLATTAATIASSNATFDTIVARAQSDLSMLATKTAFGTYPYAGIPWFATPFGRDGIITALFTLWIDPTLARGVLKFLAATQATAFDPSSDAEPGKIVHEMRAGEMARLREVPFARYYGSVDATPLFIVLLGAYYERTADLEFVRELWPNCKAALAWIDRYGDLDGDGFVEYARKTECGLDNQGWKDSHDAIFHADGRLAEAPIALCEVQAYVFAAKCAAAELADALDDPQTSRALLEAAATLHERFEAAFWCEELGTYALALDARKEQCRVVASNAGHALFAGIASVEHAARVARVLLGGASFSGWGIRTVATGAARYNPMSYHDGSVWPHDNALIAMGFARYGLKPLVNKLFEAMLASASYMELRRLPELFCGFERRRQNAPTLYPVACSPQAWASAAPFAMLGASLGIGFHVEAREIRFEHPTLPAFIDELRIERLRLGDASVDVHVRRHGDELALNVEERRGDVRVAVVH